jgi:hypothetical protein
MDYEEDIDAMYYGDAEPEKDFNLSECKALITKLENGDADSADFWKFIEDNGNSDRSKYEKMIRKNMQDKKSHIDAILGVLYWLRNGYGQYEK